MTRPEDDRTMLEVLQMLTSDGFDGLGEAARRLINVAMNAYSAPSRPPNTIEVGHPPE